MESEGVRTVGGRPVKERGRTGGNWCSLLLRLLQLAAAVCAFVVMFKASQGFVRWHDFMAFRFLVAGTIIAAAWALWTLLLDFILIVSKKLIHSPALLTLIVLGDVIAMLMALGAGSAAAGITTQNDSGLYGRPFMCTGPTLFNRFCTRTKAATAMAIISALFFLPSIMLDTSSLGKEMYAEEEADKTGGGGIPTATAAPAAGPGGAYPPAGGAYPPATARWPGMI